MKNLFHNLIKLGENEPELREHIDPILSRLEKNSNLGRRNFQKLLDSVFNLEKKVEKFAEKISSYLGSDSKPALLLSDLEMELKQLYDILEDTDMKGIDSSRLERMERNIDFPLKTARKVKKEIQNSNLRRSVEQEIQSIIQELLQCRELLSEMEGDNI